MLVMNQTGQDVVENTHVYVDIEGDRSIYLTKSKVVVAFTAAEFEAMVEIVREQQAKAVA